MATLQSPGVGSGLDVNGIVTQLVAAARAPAQQRITRQQQQLATEISAVGSLKGALASFQSALDGLKTTDVFQSLTAKSSDETILLGSATTSAVPGSYSIEVTQLAKAHQLASNAFASGSTQVVGTGTLTVTVGTTNLNLEITSSNNTVAGIRDAINGASNNPGVKASIINASDGAHLVLTATNSGAASAIKVTQTGGDGGLSVLVYDPPGTTGNYSEVSPAQNSIVKVAGFTKTSSTNVVTGVIDGVTLTLKKQDPGVSYKLDVAYNSSATIDKVKSFVTQYNSLAGTIGKLRSYDASTKVAGPLLGDALLNSIESQVRNGVANQVAGLTGDYTSLASIGIKTNADGTLTLDSTKLQASLDKDASAVGKIFASADGVAKRLATRVTAFLASDGQIAARNAVLDKGTKQAADQVKELDARMALVEERYRRQFSALDTLLSQMQSTSNYLSQQLASTANISNALK